MYKVYEDECGHALAHELYSRTIYGLAWSSPTPAIEHCGNDNPRTSAVLPPAVLIVDALVGCTLAVRRAVPQIRGSLCDLAPLSHERPAVCAFTADAGGEKPRGCSREVFEAGTRSQHRTDGE